MPRKIRKDNGGRTDVASENLHIICGHNFFDLQPKNDLSFITALIFLPYLLTTVVQTSFRI